MRAVRCKSEPTFRRRLLFASALFISLFFTDIYLVADLTFRDLSHRKIDEALKASLEAVEVPGPDPYIPLPEDVPPLPSPADLCPPGDPQSLEGVAPCITSHPEERPGSVVFRSETSRRHRVITDLQGRVIRRIYVESGRFQISPAPRPAPTTGHGEVLEEWQIDGRPQSVIAVHQPASPGATDVTVVGIPKAEIDRHINEVQRDLQIKLWIGAGVAMLILLIAFLYVLRLLSKTRQLEAQAQMDDRLAFVGGLAAGLAHEIRNPLNVLSMNLQMLEEEITAEREPDAGEIRLYMSALQGEIRRLSSLVNNFLSYARPNQPHFETGDLNRILREICKFIEPEFENRQLTLHQKLSPYIPPVDLDQAQFRQAVMNVLMNATHILKPGGTVSVGSRVGNGGEAIVTIEDDGPGIPEEDRARIFEVFYSSRGGGTGLGLPIAARVMEAHGGSITVEGGSGKGARFVLRLPQRHPERSRTRDDASAGTIAPSEGS